MHKACQYVLALMDRQKRLRALLLVAFISSSFIWSSRSLCDLIAFEFNEWRQ